MSEPATTLPELKELIEQYTRDEVAGWKVKGLRDRVITDTRSRLSQVVYHVMQDDEIKDLIKKSVKRHVEKWSLQEFEPSDAQIREANRTYQSAIDNALRSHAHEAGRQKAKEIIDVLTGEAFKN